ncbi:MAG: carboxypeptidase regulatory-like domain-containing protein [Longimicrobiales bacterium]|nr:carboxypeptidase regulatory-like domain-containing protein [Longimicrobiales bacterium]
MPHLSRFTTGRGRGRSRLAVRRGGELAVVLAALFGVGGTPGEAQIVTVGIVTDDIFGIPAANVTLTLSRIGGAEDSVVVTTDEEGRFAALLPGPGRYQLTARHLLYEPLTWSPIETTTAQETIELFVELRPRVTELEGIVIEAKREFTDRRLERRGFYQRERKGFGKFITPEDIERRRMVTMSLFRGIPGLFVTRDGRGLRMRGGGSFLLGGSRCAPTIFVDGAPYLGGTELLDVVSIREIHAVEVYPRAIQVPAEYRGRTSNNCGVVLIWTPL